MNPKVTVIVAVGLFCGFVLGIATVAVLLPGTNWGKAEVLGSILGALIAALVGVVGAVLVHYKDKRATELSKTKETFGDLYISVMVSHSTLHQLICYLLKSKDLENSFSSWRNYSKMLQSIVERGHNSFELRHATPEFALQYANVLNQIHFQLLYMEEGIRLSNKVIDDCLEKLELVYFNVKAICEAMKKYREYNYDPPLPDYQHKLPENYKRLSKNDCQKV